MRNLWGGPCRMRFPLTVLRPCNLFGLSVPNVVAMYEYVVPLRDHALAWYASWDAHAHHHAGDSIETLRNFESGMGVLSSTSQFGTRGISPLQSLVFGKFRLSRSSRHAHHRKWLYSHFADFGWFGWVARRCTQSSSCWTISCYGIILHFVIPLLVVWVTCTWNELETFFLFVMGHPGRETYGGLWNCSWKMWDDVTDECHRDIVIQLGTIWDFSPCFGRKSWVSDCVSDSACDGSFSHVRMSHVVFGFYVFRFAFLRRVTWKDDFYTWRLSV